MNDERNKGTVRDVPRMWNKGTVPDVTAVPPFLLPPVLQPQQQAQDLHTGKGIRLCQAEALRTAVNDHPDILCDRSHKTSENILCQIEKSYMICIQFRRMFL